MKSQTQGTILCALCGIKFIPESNNICQACIIQSISETKMLEADDVNFCKYCERYEGINCQRQSLELMNILLKKIKGLKKVKFINSSFIWTEPHSKRMKIKVIFEREINEKMKAQFTEVVTFVEKVTQCVDCKKKFTPHHWHSSVQVRQYVNHKKTFHHIEQQLLKQKISDNIMKTQEEENGLNFYFGNENDAETLVSFFKYHYPISLKNSQQLISHNEQNSTANVKNTFSIAIPKICKDDLIRIPRKLSKELGSCCQVLLCTKIGSYIYFLDLRTFKKIQISGTQYFIFENQIQIFSLKHYGKKFNVLDCQKPKNTPQGSYQKHALTVMKQDQFKQIFTICHFGEEQGKDLIGFDLGLMDCFEDVKNLPDFIMVKKVKDPSEKKKKRKQKRQQQRAKSKEVTEKPQTENLQDDDDEWEDQPDEKKQQ